MKYILLVCTLLLVSSLRLYCDTVVSATKKGAVMEDLQGHQYFLPYSKCPSDVRKQCDHNQHYGMDNIGGL